MAHPHPSAKSKGGRGRRWLCVFLTLLTLFLLGTVVVLSTVVAYFGVDQQDVITEREMDRYERLAAVRAQPKDHQKVVAAPAMDDALERRAAALDDDDDEREWEAQAAPSGMGPGSGTGNDDEPRQRIPKIVHQTWMVDTLPDRWEKVRQGCQALHPDYEYMLWTDAGSREFIATNYPWFLSAFDGYPYPIQRADAIRYFVLHHYGGIYMDLDVGCQQRMDPLLYFPVILPATIPVGVSNDIMLSEKGHPFMDLVIHNLVTFNHQYGTNYPTVMFSTGPMFLSAQYGLWPKEDPEARIEDRQVRILPRRWYGKNAPEGERELAYFSHFYGSSWHADDAGFITFLGKFGVALMYMGFGVVFFGAGRLLWSKRFLLKNAPRTSGPIALPFHVPDPYGRPGTPGSRPGSPAHGHQRRESDGGPPSQQQRGGVLYYLPVWFLPPGTPASPSNGNGQGGWTQYIPGFAEDATERGYHPIPGYSRPPSPSGNSIYNAAGAVHDGAFDGQPLDSLRQPLSPRPSTASAPSSPTASPPAYTTLKGWGSFFRPSLAGPSILSGISTHHSNASGPVLPLAQPTPRVPAGADPGLAQYTPRTVAQSGHVAPGDRAHAHERSASGSGSAAGGPSGPRHRARSPLPPAYAGPAPVAPESGFAPPSPGGPRRGSAHSPVPPVHPGDGLALAQSAAPAPARRPTPQPVPAEAQDDLTPVADEWDGDNDNVEDEVDRLLRELEPDVKARDE